MSILWKEEYNIGLEAIDSQHRKFIEILDRLSQSFLKKDRRDQTAQVLEELRLYAESHFLFEERYFHEFHYEYSAQHEEGHKMFRLQVQRLQERFDRGEELVEYDIFQFMNDWLLVHVLQEDKKFVSCFKENGIK